MAKSQKTIKKLGLSFGAEDIFLTEVEHTNGRFRISKVIPFELNLPFSYDTIKNKAAPKEIGALLSDTIATHNITTKDITVSLDLSHVIIIQIPADADLKEKELKDQVSWEISQYINSPLDFYRYDFHKNSISTKRNIIQLVLVGTRKGIVDFMVKAVDYAGLQLNVVDVDIFAALKTFKINYKTRPKERSVLIEIGQEKIVFTLIKNDRFLGHHTLLLNKSGERLLPEKIIKKIKSNLRILFADYQLGAENEDFDKKYIYRSSTNVHLKDVVNIDSELDLEIINPFEKIRIAPKLHEELDTMADNSQLMEPIGLAIR